MSRFAYGSNIHTKKREVCWLFDRSTGVVYNVKKKSIDSNVYRLCLYSHNRVCYVLEEFEIRSNVKAKLKEKIEAFLIYDDTEKLKTELQEIKTHLFYRPNGPGFTEAQSDFQNRAEAYLTNDLSKKG